MQYRKLGATGLTVSRLCLGTMTFGAQADEASAHEILDRATEAGIDFIDTADIYPSVECAGVGEAIVGRWLAASKGRRERFIVATKGGGRTGPAAWDRGGSRKHLLAAIDVSLTRLRTDYVDLYQLHMDDPDTPLDETLEALDTIVRSGKARYIGVSNIMAYRLARALGRADVLRTARYVSVQPRYNLLFRQIERELLPLAAEEQLAVIPYNPLAGGLLTGKYRFDAEPQAGRYATATGSGAATYQARYWSEQAFATVERLSAIAVGAGLPLAQLALSWVLARPAVTSVLIGASRPDQLTATLAAADTTLSDDIRVTLDEATHAWRMGDAQR
jgi:1-deoxyxylulose-5-phosphate synthase